MKTFLQRSVAQHDTAAWLSGLITSIAMQMQPTTSVAAFCLKQHLQAILQPSSLMKQIGSIQSLKWKEEQIMIFSLLILSDYSFAFITN